MPRVYGYCRISTPSQNIERQIRNIITSYPGAKIYLDECTGWKTSRPKWDVLLKAVKSDDTIVFDSVSRMSRNAEEGFRMYKELYLQGVNLVFLKEPHINTDIYREAVSKRAVADIDTGDTATNDLVQAITDAVSRYMFALAERQIRIAFEQSEKEVADMRQRTREGIETARQKGKKIGQAAGAKLVTQKSVSAKKIILKHSKDFGGTLNDTECMRLAGVSRNSYYKYKGELKTEVPEE